MTKQAPPALANRNDVYRLELRPETKLLLLWLLDMPAAPYERDEVARHLGLRPRAVEDGLVVGQRRDPVVFARALPDGTPLRGRHAFIPVDSPLRAAWAAPGALPAPLTFEEATAKPVDVVGLTPADEVIMAALDNMATDTRDLGERTFSDARAAGKSELVACEEALTVSAYTHARLRGDTKTAAKDFATAAVALLRRKHAESDDEREAAASAEREAWPSQHGEPAPLEDALAGMDGTEDPQAIQAAVDAVEPPPWERDLPGTVPAADVTPPNLGDEAAAQDAGHESVADAEADEPGADTIQSPTYDQNTDPTAAISGILDAATPEATTKSDGRFKKKKKEQDS